VLGDPGTARPRRTLTLRVHQNSGSGQNRPDSTFDWTKEWGQVTSSTPSCWAIRSCSLNVDARTPMRAAAANDIAAPITPARAHIRRDFHVAKKDAAATEAPNPPRRS